jgi:transposase
MKDVYVGIDIGAQTLHVGIGARDGEVACAEVTNDSEGIAELIRELKRLRPRGVVVEATGAYGMELMLALYRAGISVMRANPKAVKQFAGALMRRAKTDRTDADLLVRFAWAMPFVKWTPPPEHVLKLRALVRRMQDLIRMQAAEKARKHAAERDPTCPSDVPESIAEMIRLINEQVDSLESAALEHVRAHPDLAEELGRLITVPGIAERSALKILAEWLCFPTDLTIKQLVAMIGLDPRPVDSGLFEAQRHISKRGNPELRETLYMVAVTASRVDAHVKAFYNDVRARHAPDAAAQPPPTASIGNRRRRKNGAGKIALVAVMRKLVHALAGMMRHKASFEGSKFRKLPDLGAH